MQKNIFKALGFILIGAIGGILGSSVLFPWLAGTSLFGHFSWLKRFKDGTTIVNQSRQIIITENQALEEAAANQSNVVVGIIARATEKVVNKKKIILTKPETVGQGSGFILTSDGLVVTTEWVAPEAAQQFLVIMADRQISAAVQKRDKDSGLVLLKINQTNLPVVTFADNQLKLGEEVFLIAADIKMDQDGKAQVNKFIDKSFVKQISPQTEIGFVDKNISGSPVFNIKGEVIGVNSIDDREQIKLILSPKIKNLLQ